MKTEDQLRHDWQTAIYAKAADVLSGWEHYAGKVSVRHLAYMSEGPLQIHEIGPVSLSWDEVNKSWTEAQEEVFSIWDLADQETVDKIEGNRARCDDFGGCPFKDVCHGTLRPSGPMTFDTWIQDYNSNHNSKTKPKELPVTDPANETKVQRLLRLQAERAAAGSGLNPPQETLTLTPTPNTTRPDITEVVKEQAARTTLEYTLMNKLGYKAAEVERMSVENLQQVVDANLHRKDASILPSGRVVRPVSMREVTNAPGAEIPAGTLVQEVAPNEVVPAVATTEKTRTRRPKNWKLLLVDSGAFAMEQVEAMTLDQMETECNLRRDGKGGVAPAPVSVNQEGRTIVSGDNVKEVQENLQVLQEIVAPARTIVVNRDGPNQTADDQVLLRLRTRIQELEQIQELLTNKGERLQAEVHALKEDLDAQGQIDLDGRPFKEEGYSDPPRFTLYLDAVPLDGKAKDLAEHLRPLMQKFEEKHKTPHYTMVDGYNVGVKFLAAAMFSDEGRIPDGGEFYVIGYPDWRDGVVGALSRDPRCRIVKGVK